MSEGKTDEKITVQTMQSDIVDFDRSAFKTNTYKIGEDSYEFAYDEPYEFTILHQDEWMQLPLKRGYLYDKYNVIGMW